MNRSITLLLGLWAWFLPLVSAQYLSPLEKLRDDINTQRYDEIRPVVSPDGQQLFFTREAYPLFNATLMEDQEDLAVTLEHEAYLQKLCDVYSSLSGQSISDPINSSYNQDIWVAENHLGTFDRVTHPGHPLNNAFPNSICAFDASDNTAIVLNRFPKGGGILPGFSQVKQHGDRRWGEPQAIEIEGFATQRPDVNLSVSEDGEVLLLSQQAKGGYGNSNDLYVSFRLSNQKWSKPRHLGPAINSVYHETSPFLSADKKVLFFASNRRGGAGGSDLYFVQRLDDSWTRWTAPRRFLAPINSAGDDTHPFFHRDSGYLYFSSKRDGSSDIYRVKISLPALNEVAVSGRVIADDNGQQVKAVIFSGPSKDNFFRYVHESHDGHYRISVPKGEAYEIMAQRPGYVGQIAEVEFQPSHVFFKDYRLDLRLSPMESGKIIPLKKIYFQKSKAVILESSRENLVQLVDLLRQTPGLYISIEGHTDNLGESLSLQKLSEDRAKAIGQYLVEQGGFPEDRVKAVGYGAGFPLNDNSTEALRQRNRRVEIRIERMVELK